MPDYFVPLDTTQYTRFHRELAAKSFIIDASLKYIDSHRKQLKKSYPTFDKFAESYEVPKDMIDKLLDDAAKKDVKPRDDEELQNTLPQLRLQLKALIGRDLWGMSEYFQIINQNNHIVNRALEVLSTPQQQ